MMAKAIARALDAARPARPASTPGPWVAIQGLADNEWTLSRYEDSQYIGRFTASSRTLKDGRHDASLIAAAPDMLAALKAIQSETDPPIGTPHHAVNAAIAKAEGRS